MPGQFYQLLVMRLSLINIVNIFCVSFLLVSCEKQIPWNYANNNSQIVISGIITDDLQPFAITISKSVANPNDSVEYIGDAEVFIVSENDTVFLDQISNKGVYSSISKQRAVVNRNYVLHVKYNGNEYTATDKMMPITESTDISYYQTQNDTTLFTLNFDEISQKNQMFLYQCNWDFTHTCDSCMSSVYSYSFNTLDVSEIFAPSTRNIYFPKGTKILRTQYSLSNEYAQYLRSMLLETRWSGGYFDENSAPITGNISNNGLGYFAVCAILRDSTVVSE